MTIAFCVLVFAQGFVAIQTYDARSDLNQVIKDAAEFTQQTCENRQASRVVIREVMFKFVESIEDREEATDIATFIQDEYPPLVCP